MVASLPPLLLLAASDLDGLFCLREDTTEAEFAFPGLDGAVEPGTVIDVPEAAFPPFTAATVPALNALTGVETSGTAITWDGGAMPDTPIFIHVNFKDLSGIDSPGREEGLLTDEDPVNPLPVPDLPEDIRCATRDTGRFELPEDVRRSIAMARESALRETRQTTVAGAFSSSAAAFRAASASRIASTCSHTFEMTTDPSPTAEATRLTEPARTSPTTKMPSWEVA